MKKDTRILNAATVEIQCEDHTIGNLLRGQLLKDKSVLFSGYRVPHPLEPKVELKVQTDKDSTPQKVFGDAINGLIVEMSVLQDKLRAEVGRVQGSAYQRQDQWR